jgi:hypothetical protein
MYLPCTAATVQSTGQVSSAISSGVANDIAAILSAVNQSAGQVVVLSQVAGSAKPITSVSVDTKLDIQRRRADKVAPTTRSSANVTPIPG